MITSEYSGSREPRGERVELVEIMEDIRINGRKIRTICCPAEMGENDLQTVSDVEAKFLVARKKCPHAQRKENTRKRDVSTSRKTGEAGRADGRLLVGYCRKQSSRLEEHRNDKEMKKQKVEVHWEENKQGDQGKTVTLSRNGRRSEGAEEVTPSPADSPQITICVSKCIIIATAR